MNDLGMADDQWTDRISYLTWHLGNEVGRRWWDGIRGTGTFPEDLVAAVDGILLAADHRDNQNLLDALLSDEGS